LRTGPRDNERRTYQILQILSVTPFEKHAKFSSKFFEHSLRIGRAEPASLKGSPIAPKFRAALVTPGVTEGVLRIATRFSQCAGLLPGLT